MVQAIDGGETASAARRLLEARQALVAAHATLAPYDQKRAEGEMRELERRLDAAKAARPKAKFAFKRAARTPASEPSVGAGGDEPSAQSTHAAGPSAAAGPGGSYALASRPRCLLSASDISPTPSADAGITLTVSGLTSCLVDLRAAPVRNLHLSSVRDCVLLLPAGAGLLAHGLERCVLSARDCAQVRVHDSRELVLALGIDSFPIIEGCRRVFTMPTQGEEGGGRGRWDAVLDFDCPEGHSPNWRPLREEEQERVRAALRRAADGARDDVGVVEAVEDVLATIPA